MNIVFLPPKPVSILVYHQKKNPLNPQAHWVITGQGMSYPLVKRHRDKKPGTDDVRQYIEGWFPEGDWLVTPYPMGYLVSPAPQEGGDAPV